MPPLFDGHRALIFSTAVYTWTTSGMLQLGCIWIQSETRSVLVWQIAAYQLPACRARLGVRGIGTRLLSVDSSDDDGAGVEYAFAGQEEESSEEDYGTTPCGNVLDAVDFAPL